MQRGSAADQEPDVLEVCWIGRAVDQDACGPKCEREGRIGKGVPVSKSPNLGICNEREEDGECSRCQEKHAQRIRERTTPAGDERDE